MNLMATTTALLIIAIYGCGGSGGTSDSSRFSIRSAPQRITFQYNGSDVTSAWDTTSQLPPNMTAPKAINRVSPEYPPFAIRVGAEAKVIVTVWIGKDGKVQKAVVLLSGNELFNQTTIEAASKWLFTPFLKDGVPAAIWANLEFDFIMKDAKPVVIIPD